MRELELAGTRYLQLSDDMLPNDSILLIQCDNEADSKSICEEGATFKSQGNSGDSMNLCLKDKTLACKYVETTNLLLLVDVDIAKEENEENMTDHNHSSSQQIASKAGLLSQLQSDMQAEHSKGILVQAQSNFIVETVRHGIPVEELHQALQQHRIDMDSVLDLLSGSAGLAWEELQESIVASDCDIVAALQHIRAAFISTDAGPVWCFLAAALEYDLLEHCMLTAQEHSLKLGSLDFMQLLSYLRESDDELSRHLAANDASLAWHIARLYGTSDLAFAASSTPGSPPCAAVPARDAPPVSFDPRKVARGCASAALRQHCDATRQDPGSGRATAKLRQVQREWNERFPATRHWVEGGPPGDEEDARARAELLEQGCQGLGVLQDRGEGREVLVLFEDLLPLQAKRRFGVLFGVQRTWGREEIEPYLQLADGECGSATELLLKYARAVRDGTGAAPRYCAR